MKINLLRHITGKRHKLLNRQGSKFRNSTKSVLAAFLLLSLGLGGCQSQNHAFIAYLSDNSKSAQEDAAFTKEKEQTCFGIADAAKQGDLYANISVSEDVRAADPETVADPDDLFAPCKKQPQVKGKGTHACPAWSLAVDMSDRNPKHRPIVISMIQANELEQFCPEVLQKLAQKVAERKGQVIIVGSTNAGNTGFNAKVWQTLKSYNNTKLCAEKGRVCVQEAINSVR